MPGEQPAQAVIEQVAPAVIAVPSEGVPAPTAESETAPPPDGEEKKSATPDPEAEKRRENRRFEKRIDRLHRRAAEAEARAALFERQAKEATPASAPQDPGAPRLEQFDYDPEKYAAAKAAYAEKNALEKVKQSQRQQAHNETVGKLVASWEEKASEAEAKYDDFSEVVGELKPTNALTTAIMDAENAADVAYYLGKHLKEAQRIAALPPLSQVREIGKLEAKLLAEAPKPKQPSKAPAPIAPLTGSGQVASSAIQPNEEFESFLKKRNAQLKRK